MFPISKNSHRAKDIYDYENGTTTVGSQYSQDPTEAENCAWNSLHSYSKLWLCGQQWCIPILALLRKLRQEDLL